MYTICQECAINEYNFDPSEDCKACPEQAQCIYGATVTPKDGYWQFTSFSPNLHRCTILDACEGVGRLERLSEMAYEKAISSNSSDKYYVFGDEQYNQCSKGYKGVLCGTCDTSYGKVNYKCQKCPEKIYVKLCIIAQCIFSILIITFFLKNVLNLRKRLEFNRKLKNQDLQNYKISMTSLYSLPIELIYIYN